MEKVHKGRICIENMQTNSYQTFSLRTAVEMHSEAFLENVQLSTNCENSLTKPIHCDTENSSFDDESVHSEVDDFVTKAGSISFAVISVNYLHTFKTLRRDDRRRPCQSCPAPLFCLQSQYHPRHLRLRLLHPHHCRLEKKSTQN